MHDLDQGALQEIIDSIDPSDHQFIYLGLTPSDLNRPIYRTTPLQYALDLVQGKNAVVHPSLWDDPLENAYLKTLFRQIKKVGGVRTQVDVHLDTVHYSWFGQCWTFTEESDALWRIYAPRCEGCEPVLAVKVRSSVRKVLESAFHTFDIEGNPPYSQVFLGKVKYADEESVRTQLTPRHFEELADTTNRSNARTLLVKRNEFRHEDEVRLLYFNPAHLGKKVVPYKFKDAIIDEVVLDPRCTDEEEQKVREAFDALGFRQVRKSSLYDPFGGYIIELPEEE